MNMAAALGALTGGSDPFMSGMTGLMTDSYEPKNYVSTKIGRVTWRQLQEVRGMPR